VVEVDGTKVTPERIYATTRSVEFDAVILVSAEAQPLDVKARILLQETYHHCKPS
jgi:hypothetical protein